MPARLAVRLIFAALALAFLAPAGASANAGSGFAGCDYDGCEAEARDGKRDGGKRKADPRKVECRYNPVVLEDGQQLFDLDGRATTPDGEGQWYERVCTTADGVEVRRTLVYLRPREREVAHEARDRLDFPDIPLTLNPPGEQTVNFRSLLSIDDGAWQPLTATAAIPGLSVTVVATPTRVVWSMGDGGHVTCEGSGAPYDPTKSEAEQDTSCSYLYRRSSAREPGGVYRMKATVEWAVTWTVTGGAGGGSLGTLTRETPPVSVRVVEVQSVNTKQGRTTGATGGRRS